MQQEGYCQLQNDQSSSRDRAIVVSREDMGMAGNVRSDNYRCDYW